MYYKTRGYRIFNAVNYMFLSVLAILCILPMIHVLAVSFSGSAYANANLVTLWPMGFTLEAYEKTMNNNNFVSSLLISIARASIGTFFTMTIVLLTAYPLSKSDKILRGKSVITWFFVFTMLFHGGIIPSYILIQKLGLINSFWALILPSMVATWNIILMLNFFRSLPKELEEAALIDGAGHFTAMIKVFIPISMPAIATLSLFSMVGHWNSWFDGLIYMTKAEKYPLATFLQSVIVQQDFSKISVTPEDLMNISQRTVKAAQIFIGAIPIILVYPFLQRYFVRGIVLGAVKE